MSERTSGECPQCEKLQREFDLLKQQVEWLTAALEETRRAGKRQAAPFRKKAPKPNPQKPGRKPGGDYGEHHRRAVPETIDETYEAPLPEKCLGCGGSHLTESSVQSQYQVEIPRRPITREFHVHVGRCDDCGSRVQGRPELQTSDALGAAAVQLGPTLMPRWLEPLRAILESLSSAVSEAFVEPRQRSAGERPRRSSSLP